MTPFLHPSTAGEASKPKARATEPKGPTMDKPTLQHLRALSERATRHRMAKIVASAVNMALAGVKAPGRLAPDSDGALYYADEIIAIISSTGGAE